VQVDIAIKALQLSLLAVADDAEHPKLRKEDVDLVEEVWDEMSEAGLFAAQEDAASSSAGGTTGQRTSMSASVFSGTQTSGSKLGGSGAKIDVRERLVLMQMLLMTDAHPFSRVLSGQVRCPRPAPPPPCSCYAPRRDLLAISRRRPSASRTRRRTRGPPRSSR
jgi:hypothetical protein